MKRLCSVFAAPGQAEVREETVAPPGEGEVLVETLVSAISPGTESLFYQGLAPADLPVDEGIGALAGQVEYPLKYGYAAVGRVSALGGGVPSEWQGRLVFAFHPHESAFVAAPGALIPVPPGISPEQAAFLPNTETAVTLVLDGAPQIGEQVAVFGQGIVGLLVTALLARFPLASLVTLDRHPLRREASLTAGAHASLDPAAPEISDELSRQLQADRPYAGADLAYELSGAPEALDQAIAVTGYSGRVVIGSWYGQKRATLDLGGRFHRSRIWLISSQVSTIAPELRGRWTPQRRFGTAWDAIRQIRPERFITHRFPIQQAAEAYRLLVERPSETIQILFTYGAHA